MKKIIALLVILIATTSTANAEKIELIGSKSISWSGTDSTQKYVIDGGGNYTYFYDGYYDIFSINTSNSKNPTQIGNINLGGNPGLERRIARSGNYLYVPRSGSGNPQMNIVDVTDPTNPILANSISITTVRNCIVEGDHLYTSGDGHINVYNLSLPSNPSLEWSSPVPPTWNAFDIAVKNGYVYVVGEGTGNPLSIVDTNNKIINSISLDAYANRAITSGNFLYVWDRNSHLKIFDITSPMSPSLVYTYTTVSQAPSSMAIIGNKLFLASLDGTLEGVNISNPINPTQFDLYNGLKTWDIYAKGIYIYAATNDGLIILTTTTEPITSFACPYNWHIEKVTNNSLWNTNPEINSQGDLVWIGLVNSSSNNGDIFYRHGFVTIRLTNSSNDKADVHINDNGYIVWRERDTNGVLQIMLYDGSTITQLTHDTYSRYDPAIDNNNQVVWSGGIDPWNKDGDIFLYNGSAIQNLTHNFHSSGRIDYMFPDINNTDKIACRSNYGYGHGDVFFINGSALNQLTNDDSAGSPPKINSSGYITFEKGGNIFLYNGSLTTQISTTPYCAYPKINSKGQVVWTGGTNSSNTEEIYLYDGTQTIQLTNNSVPDGDPQINDNGDVVWWEYKGSTEDIYVYKNSVIKQISSPEKFNYSPQINNRGDLTWQGWDGISGHTLSIYKATVFSGQPIISANLSGNTEDTIIDFGPQYGIWIYHDDGTWTQLHTVSPNSMVVGDINKDGKSELIIDFGPLYGIWIYSNSAWQKLHDLSCKSMMLADMDNNSQDDIIIDFGSLYGIWIYYNNSTWQQLHPISPKSIVAGNLDADPRKDLIIDFGPPYGIWIRYNNSTWQQLHSISPKSMIVGDLDNNGQDDIIIDFGDPYGIWIYYNDSTWVQLHSISPKSMAIGNSDSDPRKDLIVDFGSQYGIWVYSNNSNWWQLHTISADSITTGDMNGNGKDEIIVDFGLPYGVWVYRDDGTWWQLHTISPSAQLSN